MAPTEHPETAPASEKPPREPWHRVGHLTLGRALLHALRLAPGYLLWVGFLHWLGLRVESEWSWPRQVFRALFVSTFTILILWAFQRRRRARSKAAHGEPSPGETAAVASPRE